jgi:hypothetical protein
MKLGSLFAGSVGAVAQRQAVRHFGSKLPGSGYVRNVVEAVASVGLGMALEHFGGSMPMLRSIGQGFAVTGLGLAVNGILTRATFSEGDL